MIKALGQRGNKHPTCRIFRKLILMAALHVRMRGIELAAPRPVLFMGEWEGQMLVFSHLTFISSKVIIWPSSVLLSIASDFGQREVVFIGLP